MDEYFYVIKKFCPVSGEFRGLISGTYRKPSYEEVDILYEIEQSLLERSDVYSEYNLVVTTLNRI